MLDQTFLKGLNQSVILVSLSSILISGDLVAYHLMVLGILLHSLMNIRDVLEFILRKIVLNCYPSLHIF